MRLEEQPSKKTANNAALFQFLPYSIDESQTDLRVKRASGLSGDLVTGGNEQKRFLGVPADTDAIHQSGDHGVPSGLEGVQLLRAPRKRDHKQLSLAQIADVAAGSRKQNVAVSAARPCATVIITSSSTEVPRSATLSISAR